MTPEIYSVVSLASRWLFAFFALMLLFFSFSWHRKEKKTRRERFKNLPGAGTVGELVVLSGCDELPPGTWFPVPREGILGSLRSCDLVVPCTGVRSQHLDFSWQDGVGLLIRPRIGCEAMIDSVPVSRRGINSDVPLLHGSVLQVGSAVLRLQLFAALSHTNQTFTPQVPSPSQGPGSWAPPYPPQMQEYPYPSSQLPEMQYDQAVPLSQHPLYGQSLSGQPEPGSASSREQIQPAPETADQDRQDSPFPRQSRVDRWKEDWSE